MADTLDRLSRVDACAVSDAMDKLGLAGVATCIHRLSTDRRIWGRVVTVKLEMALYRPWPSSRHRRSLGVFRPKWTFRMIGTLGGVWS